MTASPPPVTPTDPLEAGTRALDVLAQRVEGLHAADAVAKRLQEFVHARIGRGGLRDALTGRWLGHAVHPVLTDLPIGFWTSAFTLDLIGGRRSRAAAQRLVGLGVLSALPTAASGAADWSDTTGKERRVGLVHAGLNSAAIACFTASWWALPAWSARPRGALRHRREHRGDRRRLLRRPPRPAARHGGRPHHVRRAPERVDADASGGRMDRRRATDV